MPDGRMMQSGNEMLDMKCLEQWKSMSEDQRCAWKKSFLEGESITPQLASDFNAQEPVTPTKTKAARQFSSPFMQVSELILESDCSADADDYLCRVV